MDKELKKLLHRLGALDDLFLPLTAAQWAIKIRDLIGRVKLGALKILGGPNMVRDIKTNTDRFNKLIEPYAKTVELSKKDKSTLAKSIVNQYSSQIGNLLQSSIDLQIQKKSVADLRLKAQASVDAKLIASNPDLPRVTFTMSGATHTLAKHSFDSIIGTLNKDYGLADTIRYRDGKNYPLGAYLDGRIKTSENEVNRITSALMAAKSGIYTGKISEHGATDTCKSWEGQIVFFSESAKQLFAQQFPDLDASGIPLLHDVEADKESHIFKFNCRHIVTPWPMQAFKPNRLKKEVEAA